MYKGKKKWFLKKKKKLVKSIYYLGPHLQGNIIRIMSVY